MGFVKLCGIPEGATFCCQKKLLLQMISIIIGRNEPNYLREEAALMGPLEIPNSRFMSGRRLREDNGEIQCQKEIEWK